MQIVLAAFVLALPLFAQTPEDDYNTFMWNRDNETRGGGKIDDGDWYEWWYYKFADPETGRSYLFTYGVINPWDVEGKRPASTAFISVGGFQENNLFSEKFSVRDFRASYDSPRVSIGPNLATDKRISGSLSKDDIAWDLTIQKDWAFNAMGWLMFWPEISNIYWYPAQASAKMSGWVKFQGKKYAFEKVPAYQDRNWGRSFPKWWAWLVSNHFAGFPGTALVAGGGHPKTNVGLWVDAFVIGFRHLGKEYSFRPGDGDRVTFEIRFGKWEVQAENRALQKISISAYAPRSQFMTLPFQTPQGPLFYDQEALQGQIHVVLSECQGRFLCHRRPIADLQTDMGGIEFGSSDPQFFDSLYDKPLQKLQ